MPGSTQSMTEAPSTVLLCHPQHVLHWASLHQASGTKRIKHSSFHCLKTQSHDHTKLQRWLRNVEEIDLVNNGLYDQSGPQPVF
jgi:hypothetical protein